MDNNSGHSKRTVMIVDDELFFRELLRDILKKQGYSIVAEAVDGVEAVEKYRIHRPEITIMDIFMPEGNGIEAVRDIVSLDKDARVLICSGVGYDDDINAALQAGAKDVIYKPFFPMEVIGVIDRVMGNT